MSAWKNVQYENGKYRTSEGGGGGSSTFAGLDDVSFSDIQDGQVPKYNSTTQKWENANESGGGGTVTDVEVNGVSVVNAQKVAEIKSYKEVTQAEYQALPSSKLTDDILYCIKDSAGADGFPPLIYSDEEREVGVWRDGKPLYQKILRCTFSSDRYDFTIDSTMQIKFILGGVFASSGDYNVIHLGYGGGTDKVQAYQYSPTALRVQNTYYGTNPNGEFCIQYTKTTDTAGSGTWTTQGGYAHHYSTTEHVIGTWTDGKPLYEKTKTFGSISANTMNYQVDFEITTIDTLADINCIVNTGNTSYKLPLALFQQGDTYSRYGINMQEFNKTTGKLRIDTGSSMSLTSGQVTIIYTKTTD